MNRHEELTGALRALESLGREAGWRGSDPYDGLNARRLVGPLRGHPRGRQAIIQAVKRSPLNLRPLLGVPPERSSAALAHVAWAYALGGFLDRDLELERMGEVVDLLLGLRLPDYEEPCWGYHFDVQTRVFFYPAGAPNTIATVFAGLALLAAYEAGGDERLLEVASRAGDFFLRHIPLTEASDGAYFGYLVGDRTPIHNASLLVCALLARLRTLTGRDDLTTPVERALEYATAHQRPDGSWPYGEEPHLQWVDGYHTGYVLWSLQTCAEEGFAGAVGDAQRRGLAYYRRNLFLADGTPRFTSESTHPIDAECVAQGIQTFARASSLDESFLEPAWRVFDFAQRRMRRRDGGYHYQRARAWTIRTPHMRWVTASMLLALAQLRRATSEAAPRRAT